MKVSKRATGIALCCLLLREVSSSQPTASCSPTMLMMAKSEYQEYSSAAEKAYILDQGNESLATQTKIMSLEAKMDRFLSSAATQKAPDDFRLSILVRLTRLAQLEVLSQRHLKMLVPPEDLQRLNTCNALMVVSLYNGLFAGWRLEDSACLDVPRGAELDQIYAAEKAHVEQLLSRRSKSSSK